ncbi:HK97 family phage prohead protease [Bacillus velezensis]|uniref:HK97 family phage prohead protease n=1 Tax=Bacillus velezensis TaxID=492670 RepID=UPI001302F332|nr:HK97 family phage prohead protease [Bacillus velezensis]QGZ44589.1 HK97 family phage prohead protease [Bacillus velezensis]
MSKEVRHLTTKIELRSAGEGEEKRHFIEGYALKFEKWSEPLGGWFKEIISRNALDSADLSNVVALFNHRQDYPLARNTVSEDVGRLELETDAILKVRFVPTDTSYAKDLMVNVRSGVVNQCSFAFSLDYSQGDPDEWRHNDEEDIYERRINNIERIFDISLVTTPAYSDTEAVIGERSLEKVEQLKEMRTAPIEKLKMELELLDLTL